MANFDETFFTIVGCMDGRVQEPLFEIGKIKFKARYPDSITEPGFDGLLANQMTDSLREGLKKKINISLNLHKSKGILVSGHQECAGHPVDDQQHIEDIRKSVGIIQDMVGSYVAVIGAFVYRSGGKWKVEEV